MLNKEAEPRLVSGRTVGNGPSRGAERVIEWDREGRREGASEGALSGERHRQRDSSRWTAAQPATHFQRTDCLSDSVCVCVSVHGSKRSVCAG